MDTILTKNTKLILLCLILIAAVPRFYDLGSLGFYGDEETTSFPAKSLAEGHGAKMPSGMPYHRGLPHTLLNAFFANLLGPDNEASYRVSAAIFGTLTVPLLFFFTRPLLGISIALAASLMLATSEWHIAASREARMYVPFLFFYVATAMTLWKWVDSRNVLHLISSILLFSMTTAFHTLGIFAVLFAALPVAYAGRSKISPVGLLLFCGIAALASHLYSNQFVHATYGNWVTAQEQLAGLSEIALSASNVEPVTEHQEQESDGPQLFMWTAAAFGALLGFCLAWLSRYEDQQDAFWLRRIGHYSTAILAAGMAGAGHLHGAVLSAFVFLLLYPNGLVELVRKARIPILIIILVNIIWVISALLQSDTYEGIKSLVEFPYLYSSYFFSMFPVVFALFSGMGLYTVISPLKKENVPLRMLTLAGLLPIIAIGIVSKWEGARVLIHAYPFIVIIAAAGMVKLISSIPFFQSPQKTFILVLIMLGIIGSGLLGGHGLPQAYRVATLQPGMPVDELIYDSPYYPDHKSAGLYVAKHARNEDIVIAEDVIQQKWYAGRVDYWLNDIRKSRDFLYRTDKNKFHDIYVNSKIITPEILFELANETKRKIWLVTSAETSHKRKLSLDKSQLDWLLAIQKTTQPVYTGIDAITKVYCLNCKI